MALDTLPRLSDAQVDDLVSGGARLPVVHRAEIHFNGHSDRALLAYVAGIGDLNGKDTIFYNTVATTFDGQRFIGGKHARVTSDVDCYWTPREDIIGYHPLS